MHLLKLSISAKQWLTVVTLFTLLFQIQTVFACSMQDVMQTAGACVCEHMCDPASANAHSNDHLSAADIAAAAPTSDCCTLTSIELAITTDTDSPALVSSVASLDPPSLSALLLFAIVWSDHRPQRAKSAVAQKSSFLSDSGTKTWLSTQRLRI